jgi:hypothetical protein
MSTLNTSATFKERAPYLGMAIFFTIAVVFCIINTIEFNNLLHDDPNDDLEVSHGYTWFLIIFNGIFAFLFAFLLFLSVYLAIDPKGNNVARKLLNKLKVFKTISYEDLEKEQQKIIDRYQPDILVTGKITSPDTLRGPKITYTCPKDKEVSIPVMNEPIKRITFGDFEPYDSKKTKNYAPMSKHPLTLNSLKDLYLSKGSR